ncbi:hypothetical protein OG709_12395 [Streptomyces sp. NBC_01267]|uniref:hypothetical protein n=1 Tax=unclassified Streptomyces TaxID=2593676 RepID=UPI002E2F3C3B|nr:hypothetical protein [Streptomyces sp. NBC_01267]
MDRFRALRDRGRLVGEPTDDVTFVATSIYGGHASLIMRRVKEGAPVLYNFVWKLEAGRPTTMLREFTFDKDIANLVRMVQAAEDGAAA